VANEQSISGITLNAITLNTLNMADSVAFYAVLGFDLVFGDSDAEFVTMGSGGCFVNLVRVSRAEDVHAGWGRAIFHVGDVDALYETAIAAGLQPQAAPRDAPWGERMFPIFDPSGHDLSFAKRLER
jgi:uncharacterized glyoxalase superfamily protein PhnB